jgi:phosphodiesterase/alkaline phosphatase D-like protein
MPDTPADTFSEPHAGDPHTPETYFATRVPPEWFVDTPEVRVDREEILVVGTLRDPAAVRAFREHTREHRVRLASEAEALFFRKVSWAVRHGETELRFTTVNVPVMTRLRIDERIVLDALIEGGIARTRSEALSWCVRLVGQHQREWLEELVEATETVRKVRDKGPKM